MRQRVVDYLKVIEEEQEISEQLVPFDEVDADEMGTLPKGFAMLKGSSIPELYYIIKQNPNTHYRFCGSEYIKNSTQKEFERVQFSAVVKKSRKGTEFARAELIGSRIAELFGVNCPYVAPLGKNNRIVASLDFLSYSQEMETFAEYTGAIFNRQASMSAWIRVFKRALEKDKNYAGITEEQKRNLIKDIMRHYIVRKFILKDNDFNCGNMAVVMGADSAPSLVSFDFEFCLNNSIVFDYSGGLGPEFAERNIAEVVNEYPNEISEVLKELQMTPERYSKILGILDTFLEDDYSVKSWARSMDTSIRMLNHYQQEHSIGIVM